MAVNCRVEYDGQGAGNANIPVYLPDQQVRARVVLSVLEPMKARDVKLHISGKAKVHWTETRHHSSGMGSKRRTHTETIHFRSAETYLDQWILLWTSPDKILPSAEHVFSFAFIIPPNCPPTFIGTYGKIVYKFKVEIDRPWKFDKKFTSNFIVAPALNLNAIEWVRYAQQQVTSKSIGVGCCKRGIVLAEVRLPEKSGFVPGERIPISIYIQNKSSREVTKLKATLVEKSIFTASEGGSTFNWGFHSTRHSKNRESRNELFILQPPYNLAPGGENTFEGELLVPPCVPSFGNCSIIQVQHWLEVKISVHGCCFDSVAYASIPVVIGTIKLSPN